MQGGGKPRPYILRVDEEKYRGDHVLDTSALYAVAPAGF